MSGIGDYGFREARQECDPGFNPPKLGPNTEFPKFGPPDWGDPGFNPPKLDPIEMPKCGPPDWGDPGFNPPKLGPIEMPRFGPPDWGDPGFNPPKLGPDGGPSQAPAQDSRSAAPGDVVAQARTELGRNAHDVKLGSDAIGKAMDDDVSDWKNCANFVSGCLLAAGQITSKDMSASVDGLMGKLRETGNFTESHSLADVQKGDVVAFDHAHVMICTGFDAKGQPTFIGSNNENKDGSQKISEGPLTKWFNPNSATLKAWEDNVVIMHRN